MLTKFKLFESTLNESSFFDLSIDDILNDKFFKQFKTDDFYDIILDGYIDHNDLDEDNKSEIENSEEFKEFLKNEFENSFEDFYYSITNLINNNKIKIYRTMTVDDNWLNRLKIQGKRLGIYWSWDVKSPQAYWGNSDKKNEVTIESEINEKYVNWDITTYQNIHPTYSEEREIRLFKNTPIYIKSIEFNGEKIDISYIKNKIFYS